MPIVPGGQGVNTGAVGDNPLGGVAMPSQQNLLMAAAEMHGMGRLPSLSSPAGPQTPVSPVPRNIRKRAHRLTVVK